MEERRPIPLPISYSEPATEGVWSDLAAAIGVVAEGAAVRITIANVEITDELAGTGAALAQRAGVAFTVERDPVTGCRSMRIGPRLSE